MLANDIISITITVIFGYGAFLMKNHQMAFFCLRSPWQRHSNQKMAENYFFLPKIWRTSVILNCPWFKRKTWKCQKWFIHTGKCWSMTIVSNLQILASSVLAHMCFLVIRCPISVAWFLGQNGGHKVAQLGPQQQFFIENLGKIKPIWPSPSCKKSKSIDACKLCKFWKNEQKVTN